MPLIISPKTYSETINTIVGYFNAKKVHADFWHSNFRDFFYKTKINGETLFFLFTGYGQLSVSCGILFGYEKFMRSEDTNPSAYFIGSCFATSQSGVDLGDIIIPSESFSNSEVAQEIANRAKNKGVQNPWEFDRELRRELKEVALKKGIDVFEGRVFCRETYSSDFWFPFAEKWGNKEGYIAGEVESAAFVATCNYVDLPSAALLDVKDTIRDGYYKIASNSQRRKSLEHMLVLIKESLLL